MGYGQCRTPVSAAESGRQRVYFSSPDSVPCYRCESFLSCDSCNDNVYCGWCVGEDGKGCCRKASYYWSDPSTKKPRQYMDGSSSCSSGSDWYTDEEDSKCPSGNGPDAVNNGQAGCASTGMLFTAAFCDRNHRRVAENPDKPSQSHFQGCEVCSFGKFSDGGLFSEKTCLSCTSYRSGRGESPPENAAWVNDLANCTWSCNAGYETNSAGTGCVACQKPENSEFSDLCSWQCSLGFHLHGGACKQ